MNSSTKAGATRTSHSTSAHDVIRALVPSSITGWRSHCQIVLPRCVFFRANDCQTEDSYAVCEIAHPFAVQLDPDCEVICLWDSQTHVEIGTWSPDAYTEAFDFIRRHFLDYAA